MHNIKRGKKINAPIKTEKPIIFSPIGLVDLNETIDPMNNPSIIRKNNVLRILFIIY